MDRLRVHEEDEETARLQEDALLTGAFSQFSTAADKLRRSYGALKKEIRKLNLELDRKNRQLQRNLEEKEKANDYLDNILKSLNAGVIVMDRHLCVTTVNRAAESLTGLAAESLIDRKLSSLEDFQLGRKVLDSIKQNGWHQYSQIEFSTPFPKPTHLTASISPLRNKRDEVVGAVVIIEDISNLKKLEEQARRTDKLAAMGKMAAKIAHEVRNPLGSIELCASSLRKELKAAGFESTLLDHILGGVKTLNNVVSNMLLFTRSPQPSAVEMDLIEVIEDSLRLAQYLLKENRIKLDTVYQTPSMVIQSDRELLKQLLLNLILNAAQAMPDGGKLTVSALSTSNRRACRRNGSPSHPLRGGCKGGWIEVKIKDTGPGIPEEIRDRIFDPFFTTKDEGTGLGLAIVHNIVERLEGAVEVESKVGRESTFSVILPSHPGAIAP